MKRSLLQALAPCGWLLLAATGAKAQTNPAEPETSGTLPPATRSVADSLFYLPTRDEPATPETWGYRYRPVDFASADGTRLHGWWIASQAEPVRGTVVFSHGNSGSMGHHLGFVLWLTRAGYEVMMYDYRGYGRSEGRAERQGMIEDARAALLYAATRGSRPDQPLISYGHSLGGAKSLVAIAEGKIKNLRAVVVDSTFASYREMARIMGGRIAEAMVSDGGSPLEAVARISPLPLLVIHGRLDPVVPYSQGLKLFRAAEEPKTLFEVRKGHHGNCLSRDNGAYRKRMLEWLEEQLDK